MEASNSDAAKCLVHDPKMDKQQLMDAVRNGDVETARQLIGKGMDINFFRYNCTPLHAAMKQKSMDIDMLELLLSQPNIDLNISNERLDPPVLWVLQRYYSESSGDRVLRLIRAGCDINIKNSIKATPLHYSVKHGTETITHELLKRGADVNAQCSKYGTALHYAVEKNDLELVCMLLYYNADIYIKWNGLTPFSYVLYSTVDFEIAKVLNNYYRFLQDDVNYILNNIEECYAFLMCGNAELFEAAWPRFDSEIILSMSPTFLSYYLFWCSYSTSDWVKCLYLILNSDIAFDLIECCINYTYTNFLNELQTRMKQKCVQSEDRVGLIYMVLSLGFEIEISNITTAVRYYGLNQDLDPFIYGSYTSITDGSKFLCPLHAFIIGMKTDYSVKKILKLFHNASKEWNRWRRAQYKPVMYQEHLLRETYAKTVAFFSFPADAKNSIVSLNNDRDYIATVGERLQQIPEFPSLTELSRNRIHKYLVQKFKFKQPYQLQDFVKKLLIPNRIKDVILFKAPIY